MKFFFFFLTKHMHWVLNAYILYGKGGYDLRQKVNGKINEGPADISTECVMHAACTPLLIVY